MTIASIFF